MNATVTAWVSKITENVFPRNTSTVHF
ncbi:unnamed protein product [Callosobruchus maculatus]|uniref:Uncharacterized protein n=1 Tax=Callosobruchus maculatus TaxID=64391 RepID=A0A653CCG1_CALMS|nr:unnamed protein product [Callosobruchus maculatus]